MLVRAGAKGFGGVFGFGWEQAHFGEEVDADGRLVHVVEGVVHEARDERGLADWCCARVSRRSVGGAEREIIPLCSPRKTSLRTKLAQRLGPACRDGEERRT